MYRDDNVRSKWLLVLWVIFYKISYGENYRAICIKLFNRLSPRFSTFSINFKKVIKFETTGSREDEHEHVYERL